MKRLWLLVAFAVVIFGCGSPQPDQTSQSQAPTGLRQSRPRTAMPDNKQLLAEGINHLQEAEIAEAIKSFDDAIRANPLDPDPYIILGQTYLRLKRYDRAVDTLTAATRVAPDRGDLHYLLAVSHGLMGKEDKAKESARRSMELFRQDKDEENFLKSLALLQGLIQSE